MPNEEPNSYLGNQTLVELYGCPAVLINDKVLVEKLLLEVTEIIGLTVVNSTIHHFSPIGVSGVVVIKESHISIHTWPEYNYVALDLFTYQKYEVQEGINYLSSKLKAAEVKIKKITRGSVRTITKVNV